MVNVSKHLEGWVGFHSGWVWVRGGEGRERRGVYRENNSWPLAIFHAICTMASQIRL